MATCMIWGQWQEYYKWYSYKVINGRYRFNHWSPETWAIESQYSPMSKLTRTKFYIQLTY